MVFDKEWQQRTDARFSMQEEAKAGTVYQNRLKIAKKEKRLLDKAEYDRVYRDPILLKGRNLRLCFQPNGRRIARLGIALKKKNIKRAVDRNRAKRVIRSVFDEYLYRLPRVDVIVSLNRGVLPTNEDLRNSLKQSFHSLIEHYGKLQNHSGYHSDISR
jgi:ribonuclease P protein component